MNASELIFSQIQQIRERVLDEVDKVHLKSKSLLEANIKSHYYINKALKEISNLTVQKGGKL